MTASHRPADLKESDVKKEVNAIVKDHRQYGDKALPHDLQVIMGANIEKARKRWGKSNRVLRSQAKKEEDDAEDDKEDDEEDDEEE
jgi:hypothetical protein